MGDTAKEVLVGIVTRSLGPGLKASGFRKSGQLWWAESPGSRRVVWFRGSSSNTATVGRLFVGLSFSFEELGHDVVGKPQTWGGIDFSLERMGPDVRARLGFDLDLNQGRDAVDAMQVAIGDAWADHGERLVLEGVDPRSLARCVATWGNHEMVEVALRRIAEPLGDGDLVRALTVRGLAAAAATPQWRYVKEDPHPLELGLPFWAWMLDLAEVHGIDVTHDQRDAARAVLHDAASGMLSTQWHARSHEQSAIRLAHHLNEPVPPFSPMAPGNEDI